MSIIRFNKRFSLAAKFSICAIVLILATSVGICLFTIRLETAEHYKELVDHGTTVAATAAKHCEIGISTANRTVLLSVLESLSSDAEIAYASIMDRRQSVLASRVFKGSGKLPKYSVPNDPGSAEVRHRDFIDEWDGKHYIEILHPLVRAKTSGIAAFSVNDDPGARRTEVIGYLRLGLTQESFRKTIHRLITSITLFTSVLLLVALGFTVLFSRIITSPLKRLMKATQDIAEGKFYSPIKINTDDEIFDLARSFDHMRDRLRTYRDQVEERTSALAATNNKLIQEISARKAIEIQLQHDTLHDALTGLPNRALFVDRLKHTIMLTERRKDILYAVLVLDIDRFKVINDSLGHTIGDELLIAIVQRITLSLRPFDTVARLGGDEFAILLEDISSQSNATYIAERLGADLAAPFNVKDHEVFVTASIGIALNNNGNELPDQILRDADIAMNRAKASSKTNYVVFEIGMHTQMLERMRLETALRKAVERKELLVYYQPIVSTRSGRIVGFEALARWQHPERGLVYPDDFVPIAEESGLIVSIDRFVLGEACTQMREWQERLPGSSLQYISVNISNRQMAQPDLVKYVEEVLNKTGLQPKYLKLEITENVIIKDPESIAARLDQLQTLGVQLLIDDFGTGYSSLSYLHRLPINGFKIDRSFIKRLGANGENQEIVKTIMLLAHDLNVDVVAEGIETESQLEQIRLLNCEYWQGFLSSQPVPRDQAWALIEAELLKNALNRVKVQPCPR